VLNAVQSEQYISNASSERQQSKPKPVMTPEIQQVVKQQIQDELRKQLKDLD